MSGAVLLLLERLMSSLPALLWLADPVVKPPIAGVIACWMDISLPLSATSGSGGWGRKRHPVGWCFVYVRPNPRAISGIRFREPETIGYGAAGLAQ